MIEFVSIVFLKARGQLDVCLFLVLPLAWTAVSHA